MERFFGGNPALVLVRLAILSLIVGVVLAALGFSPFEIIDSIRRLVERLYDMGFAAVEKAFRYFLLGAVIVFPVWLVMRVLKSLGRSSSGDLVDPSSRNREA
ncbi:MAG: integrase [Methyloceanibacter sp.]|nr:integrase [Methyloceanibacter sp.]